MSNKEILKSSTALFKKFLSHKLAVLLVIFAVDVGVSIFLEDWAAGLDPKEENLKLTLNLGLGLWDLAQGIFLLMFLSWMVPEVNPLKGPKFLQKPFDRPYFSSFMAEYFRMLGRILMWGLLVIVPGFVMYVRLVFVPFIVLFSSEYESGNVDALALSNELSRRHLKFLGGILVGLILVQFALELGPNMYAELHFLPVRVLFNFAGFLLSIWSYSFIILMFDREMK